MPFEIKILCWCILLGLLHVFIAAGLATQQRGLKWNASNRDGEPKPLTGAAARAGRANLNFLETFGFFAAAVLAIVATQRTSPDTAVGVELYFWARVVYLPLYIIGIPYLRTLVWAISLWGMLKVILALL
jgi:uncharacterized MAPEG superfamily protein